MREPGDRPRTSGARLAELVDRLERASHAGDLQLLLQLCHADALVVTVTDRRHVQTAARAITQGLPARSKFYELGPTAKRALDDNAILVEGIIRYELHPGGLAHSQRAWINTFVDGLLYRSRAFETSEQALAAYAATGITLGLDAATPVAA